MPGPSIDIVAAPNEAGPRDQYTGIGLPRCPMNPTENDELRGPLTRAFHSTVHCGSSPPACGGFRKSMLFGGPVHSVVGGGAPRKSRSLAGSMPLAGLAVSWGVTAGGASARVGEV